MKYITHNIPESKHKEMKAFFSQLKYTYEVEWNSEDTFYFKNKKGFIMEIVLMENEGTDITMLVEDKELEGKLNTFLVNNHIETKVTDMTSNTQKLEKGDKLLMAHCFECEGEYPVKTTIDSGPAICDNCGSYVHWSQDFNAEEITEKELQAYLQDVYKGFPEGDDIAMGALSFNQILDWDKIMEEK